TGSAELTTGSGRADEQTGAKLTTGWGERRASLPRTDDRSAVAGWRPVRVVTDWNDWCAGELGGEFGPGRSRALELASRAVGSAGRDPIDLDHPGCVRGMCPAAGACPGDVPLSMNPGSIARYHLEKMKTGHTWHMYPYSTHS